MMITVVVVLCKFDIFQNFFKKEQQISERRKIMKVKINWIFEILILKKIFTFHLIKLEFLKLYKSLLLHLCTSKVLVSERASRCKTYPPEI